MFVSRGSQLRIYWGQLSQQVLLRKAFLGRHIPSFGHHVDGKIVHEDLAQNPAHATPLVMTTSISSPSDDVVLTEVPAYCSKGLVDRAVRSSEQCRLQYWKRYSPSERLLRLLSVCAFIKETTNLDTLARIEALQTGIPLYLLRARIGEQLDEIWKILLSNSEESCLELRRLAHFREMIASIRSSIAAESGFVPRQTPHAGVMGTIYGSSPHPFTTPPIHSCITDVFDALHTNQPVVMTPCERAPLSAMYLSILMHRAPLYTAGALFGENQSNPTKKSKPEEYALPPGSFNLLHFRDIHIVDAVPKKAGTDWRQMLLQSIAEQCPVAAHFMVPHVIVQKSTGRILWTTKLTGESLNQSVQIRGKVLSSRATELCMALPMRLTHMEDESDLPSDYLASAAKIQKGHQKPPAYLSMSDGFQSTSKEIHRITKLFTSTFHRAATEKISPQIRDAFLSIVTHVTQVYAWGNSGYPAVRVPVVCAPLSLREAVCDTIMQVLSSIRYCHACDDLTGDAAVSSTEGKAEPGLLYGPIRSPQDVHLLAEYVRAMQQDRPAERNSLRRGQWQLMAGGFSIPFPSGSFCTPACLTKTISQPECMHSLQKDIDALAMETPEGPLLHVIFIA
ncbi:betaine-aldehyde dehydrogenase [Perkinsela sp. CCAP 1560/4]|nr:betaine-aldehyde dehydrogenase [Perkinsela sp. CCAP 1560/4]|eukprot:KNH05490.1 betaine-aldehyde dehydrogenase [Perkinsela sp. CCAP 1560/4]